MFAERLDTAAAVSARRTVRLGDLQRHVALALGGEAGAKLAGRLAIPTSADTLLRMATQLDVRDQPATLPAKIVGVDDWAWRCGHRYAAILVDHERNEVIDLLPDRQTEPLAEWLAQHPTVEVIARDRAGSMRTATVAVPPNVVQVADRWHLLSNLGDAVRAIVERHHAVI